jgi:hypothetical protein
MASERGSLPGYQNFRFGMSEQDIQRVTNITDRKDESGDLRLTSSQSMEIDGASYKVSFLLRSGQLVRINLYHEAADSDAACLGRFDRMFGLVKARYGTSDQPPKREVFSGIAAISSAHFSFRDGASIIVSTNYLERKCGQSVVYTKGTSGATF